MSDPITFVHLTDLHVNRPGLADNGLLTDTTATLEAVVDILNGIEPRPAFVIVSGDLTNRGDAESYRHLRGILRRLELPLVHALGNHDTRAGFREGMLDLPGDEPYCHERLFEGAHVVVLDSSVPGKVGGALGAEQFDFLEEALGRHAALPKLLVVHHPPALDENPPLRWECLNAADGDRLARTIEGRGVAGIFCGHIHADRVTHWHGVPLVVATGLHNAIDPLYRDGLRITEGASFGLCTLRPSGLSVSFVPLPSARRELAVLPYDAVRAME